MKKFLLLFLLFLAACGHTKRSEYKYDANTSVIPEDKMVSIFVDYHIAEGINAVKNLKEYLNIREKDTLKFLDSIIVHHGFTKERFDSTMSLYVRDLDYYTLVYEKVMNKLNRIVGENNKNSSR